MDGNLLLEGAVAYRLVTEGVTTYSLTLDSGSFALSTPDTPVLWLVDLKGRDLVLRNGYLYDGMRSLFNPINALAKIDINLDRRAA